MNIPYHVMIISWLSIPIFSHFLLAIIFLSQTLNNKFKSSSLDLPPPFLLATFYQLKNEFVHSFFFFGILMSGLHGPFVSTTQMQVSMAKGKHHCVQLLVCFPPIKPLHMINISRILLFQFSKISRICKQMIKNSNILHAFKNFSCSITSIFILVKMGTVCWPWLSSGLTFRVGECISFLVTSFLSS